MEMEYIIGVDALILTSNHSLFVNITVFSPSSSSSLSVSLFDKAVAVLQDHSVGVSGYCERIQRNETWLNTEQNCEYQVRLTKGIEFPGGTDKRRSGFIENTVVNSRPAGVRTTAFSQ